jgi:hypothetical protein
MVDTQRMEVARCLGDKAGSDDLEPHASHQVGWTTVLRPSEGDPSRTHAAISQPQALVRNLETHLTNLPLRYCTARRAHCLRESPNLVVLPFHDCHN